MCSLLLSTGSIVTRPLDDGSHVFVRALALHELVYKGCALSMYAEGQLFSARTLVRQLTVSDAHVFNPHALRGLTMSLSWSSGGDDKTGVRITLLWQRNVPAMWLPEQPKESGS